MAYHLFELLIIGWMCHYRLSFASQDSLFHLPLGVALKLIAYCLKHDASLTVFMKVNVWYMIKKTCVSLGNNLHVSRIGDYPISCGVIVNDITIFSQLWD